VSFASNSNPEWRDGQGPYRISNERTKHLVDGRIIRLGYFLMRCCFIYLVRLEIMLERLAVEHLDLVPSFEVLVDT